MLYFITGNKNKFKEFEYILGEGNVEQLDIDLPEIQEIDPYKIIRHKLDEALKHHEGPIIIEDTSLYLDCLGGTLPGPLIKWFLKELKNDGIYELTKKYNNFKAKVTVLIGYAKNKDEIHFFEGSAEGKIVKQEIESDFGRDPIFHPDGYNMPYGEMPRELKNKISMRSKALSKLKDFLQKKIK